MSTFDTAEKMRSALSALTLDLEQAAITIAAKAGTARALRDHVLDVMTDQSESTAPAGAPMEVWPFASEPTSVQDANAKFDALLHAVTPAYCVPLHGQFSPMLENEIGHRYLVAADGLWLECRRTWLHLIWPIGTTAPEKLLSTHATPFGTLKPKVEIAFGKVPHYFIRGMADNGRTRLPNECGRWVTWEHHLGANESRLVWDSEEIAVGTPGRLHYSRPEHTATLSPCIDLHTHGTAPAFFSATDDADDTHDVKIAIVLGNLDQPIPTIAARLCCLGVFIPVNVSAEQVFGGGA